MTGYEIKFLKRWSGGGSVELHKDGVVLSNAAITQSQVDQMRNRAGGADVPFLFLWRRAIEAVPEQEERDEAWKTLGWTQLQRDLSETIR